jgi:GLPGLI family protein
MRKIIFLFLVNMVSGMLLLKAQVADTAFAAARYSFTHISDTTQPDNPLKENMILYLGKNMSNYTSYDRIEKAAKAKTGAGSELGSSVPATAIMNGKIVDSRTIDPSTIISVSVNNGQITIEANPSMALRGAYYKNQSASVLSYIAFAGKLFTVDENMPVIDWSIKPETKEILGMQCQKAVGDFKGRTYEAWFSSQLPYSNGPWKLGGLPGLILEAYDTKKEVVFNFTSFENAEGEPIAIAIPSDAVKTSPKEFKQYQDAINNNRGAMSGGSIRAVTGFAAPAIGRAPAGKPRQMNNPIEKNNDKN